MKFKIQNSKFLILLCLPAIALCLSSCVGSNARKNTLLPVIAEVWSELRPDALVVADAGMLSAMDAAVASGGRIELIAAWASVRQCILDGIEVQMESKLISPRMALSRQECVVRMDEAVSTYSGP